MEWGWFGFLLIGMVFFYARRQKVWIMGSVILTVLLLSACSGEDLISAEKYEDDLATVEEKMTALLSEKDNLQTQLDDFKEENASLLQQLEEAKNATEQTIKDMETKMREQFDEELESAKVAAEERADEEIAAVRQEEAAKTEAAIAKAKKEFEQQTQASTNTQSNTQSNSQSTTKTEYFQNCTDLRGTYPGGVSSSHPAYQSKMDRDKDGWACE